ncbi:substrate-binding domain-containing protein [bacterium]
MNYLKKTLLIIFSLTLFSSCKQNSNSITVFLAAFFSPVMLEIQNNTQKDLNIKLKNEISGSQVAIRKVTELGRQCDLLIIADNKLFNELASSFVSWRIDFAGDEIVLGIAKRAKYIDKAEKNWLNVLLKDDISIARVDENLGPIGYRTLEVWGKIGHSELRNKPQKIVEHVSQLAALLKASDIDYAFLYKTTCIKNDIRFIKLDDKINLNASIKYSLSIPKNTHNFKHTVKFIKYLLIDRKDILNLYGYKTFKPKFYGSLADYKYFKDFCEYAN